MLFPTVDDLSGRTPAVCQLLVQSTLYSRQAYRWLATQPLMIIQIFIPVPDRRSAGPASRLQGVLTVKSQPSQDGQVLIPIEISGSACHRKMPCGYLVHSLTTSRRAPGWGYRSAVQ